MCYNTCTHLQRPWLHPLHVTPMSLRTPSVTHAPCLTYGRARPPCWMRTAAHQPNVTGSDKATRGAHTCMQAHVPPPASPPVAPTCASHAPLHEPAWHATDGCSLHACPYECMVHVACTMVNRHHAHMHLFRCKQRARTHVCTIPAVPSPAVCTHVNHMNGCDSGERREEGRPLKEPSHMQA